MDHSNAFHYAPIQLAIVVGSTRLERRAPRIVRWLTNELRARGELSIDVIDLMDVELPAALPPADDPKARALTERIAAADAFIVVTPEYNHGYPASLKQAIDVPYREWHAKPVAFVSYGGGAGGIRAVEQLRQVFAELHVVSIRSGVMFPDTHVDENGVAHDAVRASAAAEAMIDELIWWSITLRQGRLERPYVA